MKLAHIIIIVAALAAVMALAGCQDDKPVASGSEPLFGDGSVDNSRVVARVNGEPITESMLDMRFEELTRPEKARFPGDEGRRLFARQMVDEMIRVREAEKRHLDLDPVVSRVLIAQRRSALDLALRVNLVADQEPSIDEVRAYFEENRDQYRRLGTMHASHVECDTRADAFKAYAELTELNRAFATVAAEMSQNTDTVLEGGNLGYFNRGGFIPYIRDSKDFIELIWDFQPGVNPPVEYLGKWHVVKVHERKYERPQTLDEAYDRVVAEMQDGFRRAIIDDWMTSAHAAAEIEYFGEFRPGHGKSAKELLERVYYTKDPQEKLSLLAIIADDFPESEYADDALFMAGNIALDVWGDRREASQLFSELLRRYPDSAYGEDAQFMIDNMDEPGLVEPKSIEELRKLSEKD